MHVGDFISVSVRVCVWEVEWVSFYLRNVPMGKDILEQFFPDMIQEWFTTRG